MVSNFSWGRGVWKRMMIILSREGAEPRVYGLFFKAAVQAVLLFGSETWVVTPPHGKGPGGVSVPGGETDDRAAPAVETCQ